MPSPRQAAGILLSLTGVAVVAARGSLEVLSHLRLNPGDVWVLAALATYAFYCVMLRRRPVVHPLSFLVTAMGIGSCMILPFMLWETASGASIRGGIPGFAGDRLHGGLCRPSWLTCSSTEASS